MASASATAYFVFCFYFLLSSVAAQQPKITLSLFETLPNHFFFFKNASNVAYFDTVHGNVYVSQDEGKSWITANGIPRHEAVKFVAHPFEKRLAFVLTDSTRHYRTDDEGKTWMPFDIPVPPSRRSKPLSFHAKHPGYILYRGDVCHDQGCYYDETYYTKDAFKDHQWSIAGHDTSHCQFAHSNPNFAPDAHDDLIYCVKSQNSGVSSSRRLFSSTDFFVTQQSDDYLGLGDDVGTVVSFDITSNFAVVGLQSWQWGDFDLVEEVSFHVTTDTKTWNKARFTLKSYDSPFKEKTYNVFQATGDSLAIDVVIESKGRVGSLFVSDADGTSFVESLSYTNMDAMGHLDYEPIHEVDGVLLAHTILDLLAVGRPGGPGIQSVVSHDNGHTWHRLLAPSHDSNGKKVDCDPADQLGCSLHLHTSSSASSSGSDHGVSSVAPGVVMRAGSIGRTLAPYEECDMFLSTDAGLTWEKTLRKPHLYAFGDSGSILVGVNDVDRVDYLVYSMDTGKTWFKYDLGIWIRAKELINVPDVTAQNFLLTAEVVSQDHADDLGLFMLIHLDFSGIRTRKCEEKDFEQWYPRGKNSECSMGRQQWYARRKLHTDCYVGGLLLDFGRSGDSGNCECSDADFECDYNYVFDASRNSCLPVALEMEPIPASICKFPGQTYLAASGWRKIAGNTCVMGVQKDAKMEKECPPAVPAEGEVLHQTFVFPSEIAGQAYFGYSEAILVRLHDGSIWQSHNEGFTWVQILPEERFIAFYHHPNYYERAYLITNKAYFYFTEDSGQIWKKITTPAPPSTFNTHAQALKFQGAHYSDYLIWLGNVDCESEIGNMSGSCHAEAWYSRDNGKTWHFVERYVDECVWGVEAKFSQDHSQIICSSYTTRDGPQAALSDSSLQLVAGRSFYTSKWKLFDNVAWFGLGLVAEAMPSNSHQLHVSRNDAPFVLAKIPHNLELRNNSYMYSVLYAFTTSLFLHVETSLQSSSPLFGDILKSDSSGKEFVVSAANVNRDERYVDFQEVIGLNVIKLINLVVNPYDAAQTGVKILQTRISFDDGINWKYLNPPRQDSLGNPYACSNFGCSLHLHSFTSNATQYSYEPVGLLIAVGNVGRQLTSYAASDTFLSRDGGFTWEEIYKGPHRWVTGDHGAILVMANDLEPTDHIVYSTNEGLTWSKHTFAQEKMRVKEIVTVHNRDSRRFIMFGEYRSQPSKTMAVYLDLSTITSWPCDTYHMDGNSDFEWWRPRVGPDQGCFKEFQIFYPRRIRESNCVVGPSIQWPRISTSQCACTRADFECEFGYIMDSHGYCAPINNTLPRLEADSEGQCFANGIRQEEWYERTSYRKNSWSICQGGRRLDRGTSHPCDSPTSASSFKSWRKFGLGLFAFFATLVIVWYLWILVLLPLYSRRKRSGTIQLSADEESSVSGSVASMGPKPLSVVGRTYVWVVSRGFAGAVWAFSFVRRFRERRQGEIYLPVDMEGAEDARPL